MLSLNLPESENTMSHEMDQKCLECFYVPHSVFGDRIFKDVLQWKIVLVTLKSFK